VESVALWTGGYPVRSCAAPGETTTNLR